MSEVADADIVARMAAAPAAAWERLFALADALTEADFDVPWGGGQRTPSGAITMPFPMYGDTVQEIRNLLGEVAVTPFDWPAWLSAHPEALSPEAIAAAGPATAARAATAVLRGERFSEGTIEAALRDGVFTAILERLRRWYTAEHGLSEPRP
ncbi:DUF6508 domain-containing protein [Glycomyces sp. NRRL B-16210]|uniref:DUF6508 domain-containing protein n=1 Tax=Glycomyces sp. NRRL B-16210 TaxID=1463821 RepID=UPI0004BFA3A5|nr:DUF6508 domain-containing protein [Glycomyces sp. NRRL B-16210]